MKPRYFIGVLASALIMVWACAPKPVIKPAPEMHEGAYALFSKAEQMFAAGSYDEALPVYQQYVRRFPDRPLAPAALMKIGIINGLTGDYESARAAFRRVATDYPASPFAPDAMVEELTSYYRQGRYQDVIQKAPSILERLESRSHIFRINALIGDAYMATGSPLDAMDYYARARRSATDVEQQAISARLKEAIARLDSEDVAIILNAPAKGLPMDFLLFQLGLNYTMEERYDDALKILREYLERYPDDEHRVIAENLINEINKNAVFNRYSIGCLLPLSGPYQTFGQRALKAIELAYNQFSSGSDGPPIKLVVKDTGSDPGKTQMALQELVSEQVAAILGPLVNVEIAARQAQQMGIPIITFTQKDGICEIGDKVFRNFITPRMQVQAVASFAMQELGATRFAILYPDETYGVTFMNLFWDQLIELGGHVVGVEAYKPRQTDFADPIKKLIGLYYAIPEDLKSQGEVDTEPQEAETSDQNDESPPAEEQPEPIVDFDAIFLPDSPQIVGLVAPQLAYYDVKDVYLLGTNLWHSKSLIKMADQYVQGAVMPDGFFANSSAPAVKKFVTLFEDTYDQKPEFIEAVVYDSAMILFQIVDQPQIRYRSEIRDGLVNLDDYPGVTGHTRFDENGDVVKKLHLLRIKGKRFVELD
jgi:ABC-type branched-subunit amino acid transport system substrate-binding protein/predicted negative regulator of RcsB-dependent stress response